MHVKGYLCAVMCSGGQAHLLVFSADLNGVRDELGRFLLREAGHIFQQDGDLVG